MAGKISPGGVRTTWTPSLRMTAPPRPAMRILRPLRSSRPLISLRNPAAGLDAAAAGVERLEAELGVEFVPQFLAAGEAQPAVHLPGGQPEGHAGEVVHGLALALPEIGRAVGDVGGAGLDRIEAFEGRHQFAGREQLDLQAAAAHLGDLVGQPLGVDADAGGIARPRRNHAPLDDILGDGRSRELRYRTCGHACGSRAFQKTDDVSRI